MFFVLNLHYEKFVVWDIDNVRLPIEKQDFIGHLEVTVADLISHGGTLSRSLVNPRYPRGCGTIHVLVQEVRDSSMNAEFKFSCSNLDKKDLFGKVNTPLPSIFNLLKFFPLVFVVGRIFAHQQAH